MYYKGQSSARLQDSTQRGSGTELLIVEGESAARSVAAVRHVPTQGVLPLQGKPLNAWQASVARVRASPLYQQLADALGLPERPGRPVRELLRDLRGLRIDVVVGHHPVHEAPSFRFDGGENAVGEREIEHAAKPDMAGEKIA